jgi:hypothetical protein
LVNRLLRLPTANPDPKRDLAKTLSRTYNNAHGIHLPSDWLSCGLGMPE